MKRDQEREIVESLRTAPMRFDAGETAFITRELLSVKSQVYATEYPTLQATEFIPMATGVDPYAESIVYQQTDGYGKAKIIANDAKDLPRVNVVLQEATTPVKTLGAEYTYSWLDLQRAARQRTPLTTRLAERARKVIAEGIDSVLTVGDSASGLIGLTNHTNVTITAATAAFSSATAQNIYDDLTNALLRIQNNTKGIHRATNILLPASSYAYAAAKAAAIATSPLTVLQFFQANNPGVTISPWYGLETAGAAGVRRAIIYDKSADVVEGQVPLDYYEFAPQAHILAMIIPCVARVGGVQVRYPKAIEYIDGV